MLTQEARDCLALLASHATVADYTTSLAVRDLDAVRAALGYTTINLYGGSYGTRVAQHYLRRYPEHMRAVILDGVVPPADDARCLARPGCTKRPATDLLPAVWVMPPAAARFGDPDHTFDALLARLKTQAVPVEVPIRSPGEPHKLHVRCH